MLRLGNRNIWSDEIGKKIVRIPERSVRIWKEQSRNWPRKKLLQKQDSLSDYSSEYDFSENLSEGTTSNGNHEYRDLRRSVELSQCYTQYLLRKQNSRTKPSQEGLGTRNSNKVSARNRKRWVRKEGIFGIRTEWSWLWSEQKRLRKQNSKPGPFGSQGSEKLGSHSQENQPGSVITVDLRIFWVKLNRERKRSIDPRPERYSAMSITKAGMQREALQQCKVKISTSRAIRKPYGRTTGKHLTNFLRKAWHLKPNWSFRNSLRISFGINKRDSPSELRIGYSNAWTPKNRTLPSAMTPLWKVARPESELCKDYHR